MAHLRAYYFSDRTGFFGTFAAYTETGRNADRGMPTNHVCGDGARRLHCCAAGLRVQVGGDRREDHRSVRRVGISAIPMPSMDFRAKAVSNEHRLGGAL